MVLVSFIKWIDSLKIKSSIGKIFFLFICDFKKKKKKMEKTENGDESTFDQIFLSIIETYLQELKKELVDHLENLIGHLEKWNIFKKVSKISQNGKNIPKPMNIWLRKLKSLIDSKSPELKWCGLALMEYSINNFCYENLSHIFTGWQTSCILILQVKKKKNFFFFFFIS